MRGLKVTTPKLQLMFKVSFGRFASRINAQDPVKSKKSLIDVNVQAPA